MNTETYITKTSALYRLRRETGRQWQTCREAVAKMPTTKEGKRDLVHESDVARAINALNTAPVVVGIKGLSDRQRLAIRRAENN